MVWFQDYWWVVLMAVLLLPVVCIAGFARWPGRGSTLTFDEKIKSWDVGVEELGGAVERAMVDFRRKLRGEPGPPADGIDQLALRLAHACETEIRSSEDGLLDQHKQIAALVTSAPLK